MKLTRPHIPTNDCRTLTLFAGTLPHTNAVLATALRVIVALAWENYEAARMNLVYMIHSINEYLPDNGMPDVQRELQRMNLLIEGQEKAAFLIRKGIDLGLLSLQSAKKEKIFNAAQALSVAMGYPHISMFEEPKLAQAA